MHRHALKHMNEGSSIINTTSVNAYKGNASLLDYTSTKGAIVSFIRGLALQLAPKNIRVNGVAPGPVWTPLIPASFHEEKTSKFGSECPMGRAGQPYEIAPSFVFLASEDSSYFTGQVLHPNGKFSGHFLPTFWGMCALFVVSCNLSSFCRWNDCECLKLCSGYLRGGNQLLRSTLFKS